MEVPFAAFMVEGNVEIGFRDIICDRDFRATLIESLHNLGGLRSIGDVNVQLSLGRRCLLQAERNWCGSNRPGRYRRRAVLMWVMQIASPVGFYAFASIAPIVLLAKGFDLAHSLTYSALTALGYPLGSLISVYLTERIERRTLLIASTLAAGVFGVAFGLATNVGLVIAAGIATTISTVMQSNFTHIYQAEMFHTANRSTAIGIPYAASRLVGALLPLGALTLLSAIGSGGLYACCAVLLCATALAIRLLGPRTNNQQLDTI